MEIVRHSRLAVVAALGIVAIACGAGGGGGGGNKGTIAIGVDLPENGAAASGGLSTLNGIKFAVQKAGNSVEGWQLVLDNKDDAVQGKYNEQQGVTNVQALVANKQVVGMIGPYNSAVGKAEIPITNPVGLTMISPSNTTPCLTHEQEPPLPTCSYHPTDLRKGKPNNYFRVVATDDLQGPAMAQFAYETLNVKTVGVLDEKTVFGVGIAGSFDSKFKALGGKTIRDSFDPATTNDWRNYLSRFNDGGAKAVYMGGTDDQKACQPRAQMSGAGLSSWPYLGGDGIQTTQCIDDAQDGAIGLYATTAGADATKVQSAQSTIQEFKKTFTGANDFGAYTMQGYDATNIMIEAIRKALKAGKDPSKTDAFRAAVRDNVASINYTGVLGQYTFDKGGDTSLKIISVYQVKDVGAQAAAAGDLTCGTKHPTYCYSWVKQFNFGSNK